MIYIRRIVGESMSPTLRPGDIVVLWRAHSLRRQYNVGDVVMARHNGLEKIKHIGDMENAQVYLLGDNPAHSTDSRSFGWLDQRVLAGKVIWPRRIKTPKH